MAMSSIPSQNNMRGIVRGYPGVSSAHFELLKIINFLPLKTKMVEFVARMKTKFGTDCFICLLYSKKGPADCKSVLRTTENYAGDNKVYVIGSTTIWTLNDCIYALECPA